MAQQPADLALLIDCAARIAAAIGVAAPDERAVRSVVAEVVDRHEPIDAVARGLLTGDEAVTLVLAHFQSRLFDFADARRGVDPWSDAAVRDAVRKGLFGARA